MNPNPWNRLQWGVKFTNGTKEPPHLIGVVWDQTARRRQPYPGEPARALLFTTRRAAADWCRVQRAQYVGRHDALSKWRFTPVRVRERVEVVT